MASCRRSHALHFSMLIRPLAPFGGTIFLDRRFHARKRQKVVKSRISARKWIERRRKMPWRKRPGASSPTRPTDKRSSKQLRFQIGQLTRIDAG
jgi:hypothetical protein